jgi:hypothetical protein
MFKIEELVNIMYKTTILYQLIGMTEVQTLTNNASIVFTHSTMKTTYLSDIILKKNQYDSILGKNKQSELDSKSRVTIHQCMECCSTNSETRYASPRTKQNGYYCDKCLQDIAIMDEIHKRHPDQFWKMYPEPSNEHNKTF